MTIFFGAGRLGKKCHLLGKECGIVVDYFMDNNPALWYKRIEGLEVIPPEKLKDFTEDIIVLITCYDWEPIWHQLRELGVQDHQIRRWNTYIDINRAMLIVLMALPSFQPPLEIPDDTERSPRDVLFDMDDGFGLGGVQSWGLNTVKELRELGWNACLLLNNEARATESGGENEYVIKAFSPEGSTWWEELLCITDSMLQYRNIICNYPRDNLIAAAIIKRLFPAQYRVVAVIHSDDMAYYQSYMAAEPYIDKCLIVSSKMGTEMVKRGFPKEKLMYLPWKIPCNEVFTHYYSQRSEPLRIGYAGRVDLVPKRADLLLVVARELEERGIDFRMEIAGAGSYEVKLRLEIQAAGLNHRVCYLGMLADTSSFWSRQDVMITCSEYEGHSISQCEAMAAGAVPIITDTSGARDDIEDGINGFIVNIGDIDQMVERICFLYFDRKQLPILGERAYKTIFERNKAFDIQRLWEDILLE